MYLHMQPVGLKLKVLPIHGKMPRCLKGVITWFDGIPQARLPKVTGMDSALSSPGFNSTKWRGPRMAMGVVTWYDFPALFVKIRSKTIVGANMSTTMTFVEEFRVTDATSADEPTGKSRLVIVMDN